MPVVTHLETMDTSSINSAIKCLVRNGYNVGVIKDAGCDTDDSGIPSEMLDSELEDDWGTWKVVPSKLTRNDVLSIFTEFGVSPPDELIAYFLADCHLIDQVGSYGEQGAMPIPIPSGNPLGPLRAYLAAWQPLIPSGYLPLCDYGDGWGPICYNFSNSAVIWFDHEQLHSLSRPPTLTSLQSIERPLHSSLSDFFNELFLHREIDG